MSLARRSTCVIAVLSLLASGEEASAAGKGWLEKLSGPGPFVGWELPTFPIWCLPPESDAKASEGAAKGPQIDLRAGGALCNEQQVTGAGTLFLNFTFGRLKSQKNPLEYGPEVTGDKTVTLDTAVVSLDVRLHPGIDVGTGFGVNSFSGELFPSFTRLSLEPLRVVIRPFGMMFPRLRYKRILWDRVKLSVRDLVQIKVRTTLFPKSFEAGDFGASGTFSEPSELLVGYSFTLGVFLWW